MHIRQRQNRLKSVKFDLLQLGPGNYQVRHQQERPLYLQHIQPAPWRPLCGRGGYAPLATNGTRKVWKSHRYRRLQPALYGMGWRRVHRYARGCRKATNSYQPVRAKTDGTAWLQNVKGTRQRADPGSGLGVRNAGRVGSQVPSTEKYRTGVGPHAN